VEEAYAEAAPAKVNLALHVTGRRADGYHELESLVVFAGVADELVARPARKDSLRVTGPFAEAAGSGSSNLVARAVAAFRARWPEHVETGLAIDLVKNLPVAAGLGGGSADAGALFRAVRDLHGLPDDWPTRAARLGADVPACVDSVTCIGRGTGTELERVADDLAGTPVLLVNPRVPLATGPVFAAWDAQDRGAMPEGPPSQIAREGRNDLQAPAIALCPAIADVLAALEGTDAWLVRMRGSGATCFALYEDASSRDAAAAAIASAQPGWWQLAGALR
jgi:4-diphosphocytidyl-2-C-methyl-D-erythritol kinase